MKWILAIAVAIPSLTIAQNIELKLNTGQMIRTERKMLFDDRLLIDLDNHLRFVSRSHVDSVRYIPTYDVNSFYMSPDDYWRFGSLGTYVTPASLFQRGGSQMMASALVGLGGGILAGLMAIALEPPAIPALVLGLGAGVTSIGLFLSAASKFRKAGMMMEAESLPML